ncbi:glycosyltransferase family 2 protein [Candidatus Thioglobus sp.]|nr:glycosyltransferase family 2 protein [Candidatus Thioglobus sp.]
MRISLIITTYNRPEALLLVLLSIESQESQPYEVIIANDGSELPTQNLIEEFMLKTNLKIIHSFQEDFGFRAAESRNKAISSASGDYIVLIDGDMILHPEFIGDHLRNAQCGYFIQGSRVLITKMKTREVIKSKKLAFNLFTPGLSNRLNSIHSQFLSKIFSIKKNHLIGIRTCNMSFFREDCLKVNGFNNDFIGWGREDSEFVVRLFNKGFKRKTVKFSAIQYHLWHSDEARESLLKNNQLLQHAIEEKPEWCENGICKFL